MKGLLIWTANCPKSAKGYWKSTVGMGLIGKSVLK